MGGVPINTESFCPKHFTASTSSRVKKSVNVGRVTNHLALEVEAQQESGWINSVCCAPCCQAVNSFLRCLEVFFFLDSYQGRMEAIDRSSPVPLDPVP